MIDKICNSIFFDWIAFPAKLRFENTIKIKKRSSCFWITYPAKLRFEKTKNPKTISSKLDYFLDWIIFPAKLRFENTIKTKKRSNCFWITYPAKLRFEKTKNPKTISSKLDYFWIVLFLFVTSTGFKPVTF